MAYVGFGPLGIAPEPTRTDPNEVTWEIYRDKMIPATSDVSMDVLRTEEVTTETEVRDTASKMLDGWQDVFDLIYKRMGEEYPDMWNTERDPPDVRDVWRWQGRIDLT